MTAGSYAFPAVIDRRAESTTDELDAMLADLTAAAPRWVGASLDERMALLERVMEATAAAAPAWVADACEAKGIELGGPLDWEEWYGGPTLVVRNARLLRDTMRDLRDHGRPIPPGPVTQRADGQTIVGVYPTDNWDKLLGGGMTGEVWMEPGINPGNLKAAMAKHYRPEVTAEPEVCLVLGAGNVSSIGPMDVLYQLFYYQRTAILKTNPVNEWVGPHWEQALAPLVEADVLRIAYGGAEVGQYLVDHDAVAAIHITGSDKTYDAIVFGPGEEGAERKAADDPRIHKPVTAELGNVSPVIVIPGPWSDDDIAYQADHIAGSLVQNAGFNCNATRVVITHQHWNQREQLIEAIKESLARHPQRMPFYPGAEDRWERFMDEHPHAHVVGDQGPGCVPWTFIEDVNPDQHDSIVFTVEAFNGVFGETALDVERDVPTFIRAAVDFANHVHWGTLSATVLAHPSSLADPVIGPAIEEGIANLRYGSIGLNVWAAAAYAATSTTWGAFPGHHRTDIQSGVDVVHNTYLFDHPQKTVMRAPFRSTPPPLWHVGSPMVGAARGLPAFEADPRLGNVPGVLAAALKRG
ncbi:MAG: aldehyde dehydrogenase family protein [Acidimicrobiia bacterium]